jgi:hypothetical protein
MAQIQFSFSILSLVNMASIQGFLNRERTQFAKMKTHSVQNPSDTTVPVTIRRDTATGISIKTKPVFVPPNATSTTSQLTRRTINIIYTVL